MKHINFIKAFCNITDVTFIMKRENHKIFANSADRKITGHLRNSIWKMEVILSLFPFYFPLKIYTHKKSHITNMNCFIQK